MVVSPGGKALGNIPPGVPNGPEVRPFRGGSGRVDALVTPIKTTRGYLARPGGEAEKDSKSAALFN